MTVSELIKMLQEYPPHADVVVSEDEMLSYMYQPVLTLDNPNTTNWDRSRLVITPGQIWPTR
jgi:hypothetical protein